MPRFTAKKRGTMIPIPDEAVDGYEWDGTPKIRWDDVISTRVPTAPPRKKIRQIGGRSADARSADAYAKALLTHTPNAEAKDQMGRSITHMISGKGLGPAAFEADRPADKESRRVAEDGRGPRVWRRV